MRRTTLGTLLGLLLLTHAPAAAQPIDGEFRYQGVLAQGGTLYTGPVDFMISLHDDPTAGSPVGSTVLLLARPVSDGVFDLDLDFGADAFDGQQRWLELSVRAPAGSGVYTLVSPRQPVTPSPYSIQTRGLYVDPSLRVGIGTLNPDALLHVEGDSELQAIFGNNTRPTATAYGVFGQSASNAGRGVYGYATNTTGFTVGVLGRSDSSDGKGVFGSANSGGGTTYGVYGQSLSPDGTGVYGLHNTTTGTGPGVMGVTNSTLSGAYGVQGIVGDQNTGSDSAGVRGENHGSSGYGVYGYHDNDGVGVFGQSTGPDNDGTGVFGRTVHGIGVDGYAYGSNAVNYGVRGRTLSPIGYGVYGESLWTGGSLAHGVFGKANGPGGRGVLGWSAANTGNGIGVFGETSSPDGWGGYFLGRGYFSTRLGIGTPTPDVPLHVKGGTDANALGGGYLLIGDASSTNIVIDNNEILARDWLQPGTLYLQNNGGDVNIGNSNAFNGARLKVQGYSDETTFGEIAQFNMNTENNNDTVLHDLISFKFNGVERGEISIASGGVEYRGFSGAHYAQAAEPLEPGQLVVMTGTNTPMFDSPGSEPVYGIALSRVANNPRTLGAHSGSESQDNSPITDVVAAVGNGSLWVTDDGRRDLEPGDYLISADLPGLAMLDDSARFPVGHIVAQVGQRVEWAAILPDADGHRRALIPVQFERFDRHGDAIATQRELDRLRATNATLHAELDARDAVIDSLADQIRALSELAERRHQETEPDVGGGE